MKRKKKIKYLRTTSRKRETGKTFGKKERRSQTGGFLNRYDFAYAGRDRVNQVSKIAPNIIKGAVGNINEFAKERIDQIIKTGGAKVERIAPKYSTPFRMLGDLGKKQLQKIKRPLFK